MFTARLLTLLAVLPVTAAPAVAAERPNVLFIVADDLRPELGCYGSTAKTPNLDALAARGVRLDRAYCQQALCNPSRSSFLTGRRPDTLHLWSNGTHFREKNPDVMTLPLWFKEHGYETRCVGKIFHNWHTKEKGDRRSWGADEFLHYANHGDDKPEGKGELPPNLARPVGRDYGSVPLCERRDVPDEAYYDGRVAAEAVRVLGQVKDRPFFLAVGFWKPHAPFNAPKKYWDLYDPKKLPPLDPARPSEAPEVAFHDSREILGIPPKQIKPTAEQAAEMGHGYFANISYMDAQVGKVLMALDDLKLTGRTVIVFVSDHGYHVGEHGLWAKTSCFEFDARVPLIVAAPPHPTLSPPGGEGRVRGWSGIGGGVLRQACQRSEGGRALEEVTATRRVRVVHRLFSPGKSREGSGALSLLAGAAATFKVASRRPLPSLRFKQK